MSRYLGAVDMNSTLVVAVTPASTVTVAVPVVVLLVRLTEAFPTTSVTIEDGMLPRLVASATNLLVMGFPFVVSTNPIEIVDVALPSAGNTIGLALTINVNPRKSISILAVTAGCPVTAADTVTVVSVNRAELIKVMVANPLASEITELLLTLPAPALKLTVVPASGLPRVSVTVVEIVVLAELSAMMLV